MNFEDCFALLIKNEGGYTNNPNDPGGATNYGITQRVAQSFGYTGDMQDMTLDFAKHVYEQAYWKQARCDDLPDAVRFDVFDAAVNSGVVQAAKWLQRAVGVTDDGVIGPQTLAACYADPNVAKKLSGRRLMFMTDLPTWGDFGKGWTRRIANNLMRDVA